MNDSTLNVIFVGGLMTSERIGSGVLTELPSMSVKYTESSYSIRVSVAMFNPFSSVDETID